MRTAAVLPVKRFERAKRRLGASVADPLRAELVAAMVADVVDALARSAAVERTIVVTREPSVASLARAGGAMVIADQAEGGQSAAVTLGIRAAIADGLERALCIPGDTPAIDARELDALLAVGPGIGAARPRARRVGPAAEVVIVPDRHGTGTNGLLLTPPDVIAPSFGGGSCRRHRTLAAAAGVSCRIERVPSLLLDIDTGEDLAVLRERLAGTSASAASTRAVLGQPARRPILSLSAGG